jgi:hypothetical protein
MFPAASETIDAFSKIVAVIPVLQLLSVTVKVVPEEASIAATHPVPPTVKSVVASPLIGSLNIKLYVSEVARDGLV